MKLEEYRWAIVGLDNETGIEDYIDFFDNEDDAIKALDYWQADFYSHFWIESYKLYNRFNMKDMDVV